MYTFLSGGTGTPKLLEGFREITEDANLGVICNSGDDLYWNDLLVCPDLDTVLYLFSDKLDQDKYWGRKAETYHALNTLQSLHEDTWFNIGDKDLGLHIYRNKMLEEHTLSEITEKICEMWGIEAKVFPMSNNALRSIIITDKGELLFQEYFVKYNWEPEPTSVQFRGDKNVIPEKVHKLLKGSDSIILGPSNPATSIGPIFSMKPIANYFENNKEKVLAISPIEGGKAYSGPSVKLMKAMGIEPSVVGLAEHYSEKISKLVISPKDRHLTDKIEDFGIEPIALPIILQTQDQKRKLAEDLVEIL